MQDEQAEEPALPHLLTAAHVQQVLGVDRSTVYRMAADGRLVAVKVGSQWRFPADRIDALLGGLPAPRAGDPGRADRPSQDRSRSGRPGPYPSGGDPSSAVPVEVAQAVVDIAAELLGVMMVVTDMAGYAVTDVANPCPWFAAHADDAERISACAAEWRWLAEDYDLRPQFTGGALGFLCARSHIRVGPTLVGMVLAGGVADDAGPAAAERNDLYHLGTAERDRVQAALPRIAAVLSRVTTRHTLGSDR